jgi:hypothetical protein
MPKIKNDPSRYVRRSDLSSPKRNKPETTDTVMASKILEEFLTSPNCDGYYMEFRVKSGGNVKA